MKNKKLDFLAATSIVIANIIGTGVFTSLGFQAAGIPSPFYLLLLWVIGGVLALCGGLVYSELAFHMPRSGGEYRYLTELYNPAIGFLSGWVSGTVAFAAPMALAAIAFGDYLQAVIPYFSPKQISVCLLLFVSATHLFSSDRGSFFQKASTVIKLLPILILVGFGLFSPAIPGVTFAPLPEHGKYFFSSAFAVSLVYVSYAYPGWNASIYMASEVENPRSTVPLSIITGTVFVTVLYVLLNYLFLKTIPIDSLKGVLQIGHLWGENLFGSVGGKIMDIIIGIGLISTLSSMLLAGSRVVKVMGEDYKKISWLANENKNGTPTVALLFLTVIALALLVTSTFEQVLLYVGFTLTIFTTLSVIGVFIIRRRAGTDSNFKMAGYPYTALIFVSFNLVIMGFTFISKPFEATAGLLTVLSGLLVYFALNKSKRSETIV